MVSQILSTKLYIPPSRPNIIRRDRLINRFSTGLHGKLSLVSAPAGFGKTTLVTEWISNGSHSSAWLSLDDGDNDPVRFLTYVIAALQTLAPYIGTRILNLLEAPQPPPIDSLLMPLLNEIGSMPDDFVLVLDDYHILDSTEVDSILAFLIDNQPPQMHMVIVTREDPRLPLARLRVRGQLTELRAADLRFTHAEAAAFMNHAMGLTLSPDDVAMLEARTEGWIAGLQLAAISLQGQTDARQFVQSFTGSHHFVLDYLVEEVLSRQPQHIQDFLLQTSILDSMCAPLCDAVLQDDTHSSVGTLEHIRRANLFLVPLDSERRWYRYHHLFGDLLRKRLGQSARAVVSILHIRASMWYEANGFEIAAFQHAAAADDIQRAARLINGAGVPLYFRGIARPVLRWLASLSSDVLDASPSLWVTYAWTLMAAHRSTQIEHKLQAAEAALEGVELDDHVRDLFGHIAAIRAMEAAIHYKSDIIIQQAQQALGLLRPDNLYIRTAVTRALAIAYQFQGERAAARDTYLKAIAMSEASDNYFVNILATTGLGIIQELDNQLYHAAETYQRVLDLVGDPNQPITCAAYLGMARIHYAWNDLDAVQEYGERGIRLAKQIESIDSAAGGEIFLARLKLAQGDTVSAAAILDEVEQIIRQRHFVRQIPKVAEVRVMICLVRDDLSQAFHLVHEHDLPLSQAQVALAQNKPLDALAILARCREEIDAKDWHDERLKIMVLQAIAQYLADNIDEAVTMIAEALNLAVSGGIIRIFVDEGQRMQELLSEAVARGVKPNYTRKLIAIIQAEQGHTRHNPNQLLIEPLSERELEILGLVADGLSNSQISERLFISLSTVKGHNRNIFDKLQVKRRTEAVAHARELGLI